MATLKIMNFGIILLTLGVVGCGGGGGDNDSDEVDSESTTSYSISGTVSGLSGTGLVLQNNTRDDLTISSDGSFTFISPLDDGETYTISVANQPVSPDQVCVVSNGSGYVFGNDVTDIEVSCSTTTASYSVGGTVTGLTGSGLVLQNNGSDDLVISTDGSFNFSNLDHNGSSYSVSVATQPTSPNGTCNVVNGNGSLAGESVTGVEVRCITGRFNIVDTNQSACYDSSTGAETVCSGAGYDADYRGNQPDYTLSDDASMVFDNVTGLIWTQSTDLDDSGTVDVDDKLTQPDAVSYCTGLNYGGYEWRLPSIKELYSLMDFTGTDPSSFNTTDTSLLTPFLDDAVFVPGFGDTSAGERIIDGQYATTSLYISPEGTLGGADTMFGVNFVDGRIKGYPYNFPSNDPKQYYVLCVSGNSEYGYNDFSDNADSTISDIASGLMWEIDDYQSSDFEDAIAHCESSTTGGHTDWRLPDVKELQSIVDYDRAPDFSNSAAIDPLFNATSITNEEGETDWGFYWASTTHANSDGLGTSASYVSFGRALGYFNNEVVDVHGAGAQRSNHKSNIAGQASGSTNLGFGTFYYHGPQGDILRLDNMVRCVRGLQ